MSDNPYERDKPDEQVGTDDDGDRHLTHDDATGPVPTVGEPAGTTPAPPEREAHPAVTDEDPALPADDAGTPADEDHARPADDGTTRLLPAEHDAATVTRDETTGEPTQVLRPHQAERPVPRSGLAEHRSAGYLTGERHPEAEPQPETEPPATSATTADGGTAAATAATPSRDAEPEQAPAPAPARRDRDVVLEGTTAHTRPPSRGKAHVLTVLLTLLLMPVAWYLVADAGARLTLPQGNPWDTANLNVAAILELAGGLLVIVVVLLAARWSSVGAIVTGVLVIVVGVPFIAVPAWTQDLLEPVESWLAQFGDFGDNVTHHLVASGSTGRLVAVGVVLVLVGIVSHGARRQGRREVRPAVEV